MILLGLLVYLLEVGNAYADSLTLQKVCVLAVENHPLVESSLATLEEGQANYGIAKSAYYPRLDVKSQIGPSRNEQQKTTDMGENSVTLSQKIFQFGGIRSGVKSSELKMESSRLKYARTNEDVASLAISSFLAILQAQATLDAYIKAQTFYLQLKDNFIERYKAGVSSKADAQKIEVSIKTTEALIVVQREQLATTKLFLANIIGRDVDEVDPSAELLTAKIEGDAEDAYKRALEDSLPIRAIQAEIKAQEESIYSKQTEYLPNVSYEISAKEENLSGGPEQTYTGQLTVSWNLFNGFSTDETVNKEKAMLRRLRASRKMAELDIKNILDEAFNTYSAAEKEHVLAREAYDTSVELISLYLSEFDLGIRTLLDLVSAREGQTSAAVREVNSRFSKNRAVVNVILEEGRLAKVLNLPKRMQDLE